jgi:hypothetical protein
MSNHVNYQDMLIERAMSRRAMRGGWLLTAVAAVLLVLLG